MQNKNYLRTMGTVKVKNQILEEIEKIFSKKFGKLKKKC